ncbi:hypothetical protein [Rhizobium sp. 007]|uniref:hypothetical protein n=1 Tax=Rhizobium sp. 007 TaxID=2785056 RepID=UPI00188F43C2|nr:hypothetical protein [Rhizobium sp. 007]QPB21117.1 hypothetical protein ISN39_06520 [Rhizobium sp. 007]
MNIKESSRLAAFENRSDIPADEPYFLSKSEISQATVASRSLAERFADISDKLDDIIDINCSFEIQPDGSGSFHFRAYRRRPSLLDGEI